MRNKPKSCVYADVSSNKSKTQLKGYLVLIIGIVLTGITPWLLGLLEYEYDWRYFLHRLPIIQGVFAITLGYVYVKINAKLWQIITVLICLIISTQTYEYLEFIDQQSTEYVLTFVPESQLPSNYDNYWDYIINRDLVLEVKIQQMINDLVLWSIVFYATYLHLTNRLLRRYNSFVKQRENDELIDG